MYSTSVRHVVFTLGLPWWWVLLSVDEDDEHEQGEHDDVGVAGVFDEGEERVASGSHGVSPWVVGYFTVMPTRLPAGRQHRSRNCDVIHRTSDRNGAPERAPHFRAHQKERPHNQLRPETRQPSHPQQTPPTHPE